MSAVVLNVCVSETKGVQKTPVDSVTVKIEHGIDGDAHAGDWHRQVSLLANESAQKMRDKGLAIGPGDFGENLLTEGIVLTELPVGTPIKVGETLLEVTQIGKECHDHCQIYFKAGDCVMPREGVFAKVIEGGVIKPGDAIEQA
ncbi:MAG: MOSC domain-containing protein [Deltaproteobacteria bacterium]|nr:MOSC domain-containing protein [Deltaproteobacteria bacterium]